MRRAAMFAVGPSSRAWLYTPPYPGCELSGDEFSVIACRYYGARDTVLKPRVRARFRRFGAGAKYAEVDAYGAVLANANVGGDRWRLRHDGVLRAIWRSSSSRVRR